jgi:hypothetical protein
MAGTLPTKNDNNLKLFLSYLIDKLSNPLFPSVSRNPQGKKNLTAKRTFGA